LILSEFWIDQPSQGIPCGTRRAEINRLRLAESDLGEPHWESYCHGVTELLFGERGSDHVLVRVLGKAFPEAILEFDRDQLQCEIEISAGPFQGGYQALWMRSRLLAFRDSLTALYASLDGSVELIPEYGTSLRLTIGAELGGHVVIDCNAVPDSAWGPWLRFQIRTDQTYLPDVITSLNEITT